MRDGNHKLMWRLASLTFFIVLTAADGAAADSQQSAGNNIRLNVAHVNWQFRAPQTEVVRMPQSSYPVCRPASAA